jgi:death-on-curing protein
VTRYIGLAEYLWLAEQVTGVDATTLTRSSRIDLADSALHAPQAGFGDEDFYADVFDKAAELFIDLNDGRWHPDPPDVDDAEVTMLAVAAGEIDEHDFAEWLRGRVRFR